VLLAASLAAHAGRPCEEQPPTTAQVEQGMELALATAQALDASGARVVLLARAGQDLSSYGLQWSHFGLVYRDETAGAWRVLHKLNDCGTALSGIYRQGLGEFFLDQPHRYEAAFVVPTPAVQQALLSSLTAAEPPLRLHEPRYSMVAYAWGQQYQQSNQWALETLALSLRPERSDRGAAQAWLKAQGYQPTDLRLRTVTRLGARLTRANIAFDDHPTGRRLAGHIETVTVDSVFDWLQRAGLGAAPVRVGLPAR
jgi:hypothetical protein